MAKLLGAEICEDVAVTQQSGRLSLFNIFFDTAAATYPARVDRLMVISNWLNTQAAGLNIRVLIMDPDGEPLAEADAQVPPTGALIYTHQANFTGLVLPRAGQYHIRIYADVVLAQEIPFIAHELSVPDAKSEGALT